MAKQTAVINNWTIHRDRHGHFFLRGGVTDHPRQADFKSEVQETSRVVLFDPANNTAETQNTVYTLGAPAAAPATPAVS